MDLYLQFGHGMKSLTIDLAKRWGEATVILSPRDMTETQLVSWCKEFEKNNVSRLFDEGLSCKEIMDIALEGIEYDIFDEIDAGYACDCSRERMYKKILSLGKDEIKNMLSEQEAEGKARELTAVCRFCNSEYTFTEKELLK